MYLQVLDDSTVAVCSALGLSLVNSTTFKVKRLYLSGLVRGLNNYVMKAITYNKTIWISSANGLGKYDIKSASLNNFMPDAKHPEEQYHNIVSDAKPITKGKVWLSTMGYGLHCFDESSGTFSKYGIREGLENENLLRVALAGDGNVWTASHDGVSCFDVKAQRFYTFGEEAGFENKECTMNGLYESVAGNFYIGTVGGLAVFDPKALRPDTVNLSMVVSSLKVNYAQEFDDETASFNGTIAKPTSITLYDKAKTVEFEFSCLRFGDTKAISYRYRLVGFDQNWVQLPDLTRFASYSNLPEGNYTFQVVPVLQGRIISSKLLQFTINVVPPFYKTVWFKGLSVLMLVVVVAIGIAIFYRRKLRIQKEKAEQELRLQKEKERISRELHDNVGSQLTYIIKSIDTLSYKTGKHPERVQEGLDSLSDFSRDTLNQLRESIWAINTKEITLRELEAKIQDHVSKVAARVSGVELILQTEITNDVIVNPGKAIGIFRIVQEALVNSIKYANCERITIHFFQKEDTKLLVKVSDNGKGFDASAVKSHSYGLKNMKARAEEIGAEVAINSAPGRGTTVELTCKVP